MKDAARVFDLRMEQAYLRALRAAALAGDPGASSDGEVPDWLESALERTAGLLAEPAAAAAPDPMARLAGWLALGDDETDFLWTAIAVAVEPRLHRHLRAAFDLETRRGLSTGVYAALVELQGAVTPGLVSLTSHRHPLIQHHLLLSTEPHLTAATPLAVAPRLVDFLRGIDATDELLVGRGGVLEPPAELILDARQREVFARLQSAIGADHQSVVAVEGPRGAGRRTAAVAALAALGDRRAVCLDAALVRPVAAEVQRTLAALHRECLLRQAVPVLANVDAWGGERGAGLAGDLAAFLAARPGVTLVTATEGGADLGFAPPIVRLSWPLADHTTRAGQWRAALGQDAASLADELGPLAHRYRLGPGGIERAVTSARLLSRSEAASGPALTARDLVRGVRSNTAERLGSLARRIQVKEGWEDLVLPDDTLAALHRLVDRVRHSHRVFEEWGFDRRASRGIGVPVLFSGPPGTGKTMVAGIIANELDLELFQIDLSQIVSKWVGETEKNLGQVFEAAEAGHALLLFDEADALFAQRSSDVKGAQDRYANLEVNYLLQRIEAFSGIAILTTNLDTSIDKALKRRLAAHVVFYPPDEDERAELWRRLITSSRSPRDDASFDFSKLSRDYADMAGGHIRNAVLTAAFSAAVEERAISHEHLARAARIEYRTMGRVLAAHDD